MRVVQVNCARDSLLRSEGDLLNAWPTLSAVAAATSNAGANVTVVQSFHRDGTCERDGVTFRFVAEPWLGVRPRAGYAPMRLLRTVKSFQPDLVHLNGLGFPVHTRVLCTLGVPVLVQDHANEPDSRARVLQRWGLAKISGVAFTSHEQARPFVENGTLDPRTPVFAVPESSTRFRDGDFVAARRATGVHGCPAILWVAHLNDNKDPLTVIEAFSGALAQLPEAQLWCCYRNAPLFDRVRARLSANSTLSSHVHLLGFLPHDEVELYFRAADIFVQASRRESAGFALMEALACGAAPVVTDIPAFRALTGNGAVGALCAPGDANAFAAALVSLARAPRDVLRKRAVSHFQTELSFSVLGRKLLEVYDTIIADHARVRR